MSLSTLCVVLCHEGPGGQDLVEEYLSLNPNLPRGSAVVGHPSTRALTAQDTPHS